MPSSRADTMPTAANASLISTRSRSATRRCPPCRSAFAIALAGWLCRRGVGAGDDAVRADLGEPRQAELLGLGLAHDDDGARRRRRSGEAEPAVMVPSLAKAGRSLPSDSAVVSARTPSSSRTTIGSPLRCGISTGTISSSKRPFFCAAAAFWCERGGELVLLLAGELRAVGVDLLGERRPSPLGRRVAQAVVGHRVDQLGVAVLGALARASGSRCGAWVIDSMPPATTISNSPARISWSASAIASRPDRHTLLIVSDGHGHRDAALDARPGGPGSGRRRPGGPGP